MTETGSSYARRLLVEAAKHHARPLPCGVLLARRQEAQPDHVLQIAWRAQHRLFRHARISYGQLHRSPARS